MRGDAEPTWCTCSSALGRRVMKPASADMAPSMAAAQRACSVCQDPSLELVGQLDPVARTERFPVDQDGRCGLDTCCAGGLPGRIHEVRIGSLYRVSRERLVHAC